MTWAALPVKCKGRIGAANGWGANPPKEALYLNIVPKQNDGAIIYKLHVKDVPVDGFWSVSVYNTEGYFHKNPYTPTP